jgi:rhodanese-related sulfurtransferase
MPAELPMRRRHPESITMRLLSRLLHPRADAAPQWIEAEALSQQLATDGAPLVVDVRSPDEFDGPLGHIAGAMNVPLPEFGARLPELAQRQQRLMVMVCRTDRRSSAAAGQLRTAGATNVVVLRGGMERWRALGLS